MKKLLFATIAAAAIAGSVLAYRSYVERKTIAAARAELAAAKLQQFRIVGKTIWDADEPAEPEVHITNNPAP